ncbi:MAG TPA: 50S ribosomal protein L35ae [Acidobacteriota bacterium]|nr:50S ribosomal protein L35ae [Acidobacteriota bacterium]
MEGIIINFRRSIKTQTMDEMIIAPVGNKTREQAQKLVGKKVTFTTTANNTISGSVVAAHGGNGAVRVRFERGMPGQAVGGRVSIA